MILNDKQIKELAEKEEMISPFVSESISKGISHGLNSFGYDLRCGSDFKIFTSKRFKTKNTHGTGCTLSSAVATFFSCGKSIKSACELGIKYVNSAILTNPKYGKGHGPINHLNSILLDKRFK